MKFVNKVIIVLFFLGSISACDMWDMDLQDNPNAINADGASLADLYNSVQLGFNDQLSDDYLPGALARMYMVVSYTYQNASTANTMNGIWNNAYAELYPDIDALITLAEKNNFYVHIATAKIMKAYSLMHLVDLMGDVPYTEAGQGTVVISPTSDAGADVYAAAEVMLDEAINMLDTTTAGSPNLDLYYGGSKTKWATLAKTLKLRAALNKGDKAAFDAIVSAGDIIDEAGEDFQFQYGTNRVNPNSRHWMYNDAYETGDASYQNNYYMWLLAGEKVDVAGDEFRDPRLRYYFYRQKNNSTSQDATTYGCHWSQEPDQSKRPTFWDAYNTRVPYCYAAEDGYIGRDHMNGEGTPPDGPIKTSWGLYPAGGDFDYDGFTDTRKAGTTGGQGAGIQPYLLSSFVKLMQAEAVLSMGAAGDAKALLLEGIQLSLTKVKSFESLVGSTMSKTLTLKNGDVVKVSEFYAMNAADQADYIAKVGAIYDAASASGKKDVVAKEFLIAAYGNGLEAYNMYRRTGAPSDIGPAIDAAGSFPTIFLYPLDHISRNGNVTQQTLTDRVFWNTSGPALY
jgi:hypothetical protein